MREKHPVQTAKMTPPPKRIDQAGVIDLVKRGNHYEPEK
jgi:hypothetical protein